MIFAAIENTTFGGISLNSWYYTEISNYSVCVFQLLVFLKGFKENEQQKLAIILGIIFANGFCKPQVLTALFEDHLVKEGNSSLAFYCLR